MVNEINKIEKLVIVFQVPAVRGRSAALSEANSQLLGQVVDGYTNIQSVKLFATTNQEDAFAATFMRKHTSTFRDNWTPLTYIAGELN